MSAKNGSSTGKEMESIPQVDPSDCRLDGHLPQRAFRPRQQEQVPTIIQTAAARDWRVAPRGSGTLMDLGAPIHGVEAVILTEDLNHILELNEENLTVTVETGVRWSDLQATLAQTGRGYEVPLDPPLPECATVGGVLAAGISGSRQMLHGAMRNMVLGLRVVTAHGEVMDFGGKTVKNVAGLDMCKVYLGSLGTLGIILAATLRCKPLPEERITVTAAGEAETLWRLIELLRASSYYPSSIVWIPTEDLGGADLRASNGHQTLAVALEGSAIGVEERWKRLISVEKGATLQRLDVQEAGHLWTQVRDAAVSPSRFGAPLRLRANVPPARSRELAEGILRENPCHHIVCPGTGEVWAHWDLDKTQMDPGELVGNLRSISQALGGHVIVIHAPLEWRHRLDIWGLNLGTGALMRSLKARLDPKGMMAPGRWGPF
jgi:glycolate oxidase FAD binding subunit